MSQPDQAHKLASDVVLTYEADDGPISDETIEALKERVPQGRYKSVASSIFPMDD